YKNVWQWRSGGPDGKMIQSALIGQVRVYQLEDDADNIIFTAAPVNTEMDNYDRGEQYNNIKDLDVYDNGKYYGTLCFRSNLDGAWKNHYLTAIQGSSSYRTEDMVMANDSGELTVVAGVGDAEKAGLGANKGVLNGDGDSCIMGGWTNNNAVVNLPAGTSFYLTFNAVTGEITLHTDANNQEDKPCEEFSMDNISYIMPDFGGNPEPFRTLSAKLSSDQYGYQYSKTIEKCRMLLSINQKDNVSSDDLTNQWVKYEDRDPSKETAYHYFYSDDVIEPTDPRYDVMLNSAQFGDQISRRNQWALNKNHNDIHDCRNFNKAWYRGYMVAEGVGLEDIRQEVNIDDLYFANHPMAKKNGGRKEIRMSMMGNDDNRVARTFFMNDNTSGIEETLDDDLGKFEFDEESGEVKYYNLQGQRILNPVNGQVYIVKRGQEATKEVYIR
ncbi:MAG: hypothetical protein K2G64_04315, partial [Muribaculaceae bacterium]|nr:hypothetical protein [Muribaculaceae bacterium]